MNSPEKEVSELPESVMIFGCGYVGRALAESLMAEGVRVGALTRNTASARSLRELGVSEVIVADLHGREWHDQLIGKYRAVVNCVSSAGGGLDGYEKSYYEGQRSILEWLGPKGTDTYVYTGSTSVYPQDGGVTVDESADTTEAPETAQVLLRSEQLLRASKGCAKHWYVLRLAGIYGPGRHYLLDSLRGGMPSLPGSGSHHLNLIHLQDIITGLKAALTGTAPSGIYNLCDDAAAPKEVLVKWLAERLGLPVPRFEPALSTERLRRRGGRMPDRVVCNAKARKQLGWQPAFKDFRQGYEDILAR